MSLSQVGLPPAISSEESKVRPKQKFADIICLFVGLVIGISLATGIIARTTGVFENEDDSTNEDDDTVDEVLVGFCAEFGISDNTVRSDIAAQFDEGLDTSLFEADVILSLSYTSSLKCLPEDIFRFLSFRQRRLMKEAVNKIRFSPCDIEEVHPKAFDSIVEGVVSLEFVNCPITSLAESVLSNFTALKRLNLRGSSELVSLDEDIFGQENVTLESLDLGRSGLTSVPEVIRLTPRLDRIILFSSPSLIEIPPGVFDNVLNTLRVVFLEDTPLAELGRVAIANLTGLSENAIVI